MTGTQETMAKWIRDLEAQLAEAREVLREVEWVDTEIDESCPLCSGRKPGDAYGSAVLNVTEGHAPDCRLKKALGP